MKYYRLTRAGRKQLEVKAKRWPDFLGYRSNFGSVLEAPNTPLFVKARSFLRNLFSPRRVEADVDEEVHSHLEMLMEENLRAGGWRKRDVPRASNSAV